jgi:hypothetical protein
MSTKNVDGYANWIKANVERDGYGQCKILTKKMAAEFPELRIAVGFFHCIWGARQHAWLVAPDGSVVDPTRAQFPGSGEYEELTEDQWADRIPTGVCMDCGDDVFHGDTFCSPECAEATMAYLKDEGRRR